MGLALNKLQLLVPQAVVLQHQVLIRRFPYFLAGVLPLFFAFEVAADEEKGDISHPLETVVIVAGAIKHADYGPPVVSLTPTQIRSLGAGTIADITRKLLPIAQAATGNRDSSPVLLLNGTRQVLQDDINDIPIEAVKEVTVLPPAAASALGYSSDRLVINYVIEDEFASDRAESEWTSEQRKHNLTASVGYRRFRLSDGQRTSITLQALRTLDAGEPDTTELGLESLNPVVLRTTAAFRHARPVPNLGGLQISGTLGVEESRRDLSRSDEISGSKERQKLSNARLDLGLNSMAGRWEFRTALAYDGKYNQVSLSGNTDQESSRNEFFEGRSESNGPLFHFGGNFATGTASITYSNLSLHSQSGSGSNIEQNSLLDARFGIRLPVIAGDENGVRSVNVGGGAIASRYKGYGVDAGWTFAVDWRPLEKLRIDLSAENDPASSGLTSAHDEEVARTSVPFFDFTRNELVEVDLVTSGAASTQPSRSRTYRATAARSSIADLPLALTTAWQRQEITGGMVSIESTNPLTQLYFPSRFVRDSSGRLVLVDARPLHIAGKTTDEISMSLSTSFSTQKLQAAEGISSPWLLMSALTLSERINSCLSVTHEEKVCGTSAEILSDGLWGARQPLTWDASASRNGSGGGVSLAWYEPTSFTGSSGSRLTRSEQALLSLNVYYSVGRVPNPGEVDRRIKISLAANHIPLKKSVLSDEDRLGISIRQAMPFTFVFGIQAAF